MTKFDIIVALLLLISAAVGFTRGAVREIVAIVALIAAGALAIFGLPHTAPIAQKLIHAGWIGAVFALIATFVLAYLLLRLLGGQLARNIHRTDFLGPLDRTIGLFFGLLRGLVVLGVLNLMFIAATPADLRPAWIVNAATWPLTQNMGRFVNSLAPKGLDLAARLKPVFKQAVTSASGDRTTTGGYDARERGNVDDLVERSR